MKNLTIVLFTLFCPLSTIFSQEINKLEKVEKRYVDYFNLEQETIYTHLNKSSYFKNEELWFKTYVYDTKTQKPYLKTSNVYVSVYNEKGTLIKKKLFYCNNGSTHGNILVDEKLTPGTYFLKTTTNWMKNFNNDRSHIQKFEVLDTNLINAKKEKTDTTYDFQLLPEGGHLIANTKNTIGYKIIDNQGNSPEVVSGKVFDKQKNIVSSFKGSPFGMGKFDFHIKENENYEVEITLDNKEILVEKINDIKSKGIALSVTNIKGGDVLMYLRTNDNTLPSLLNKDYHLIIHRDGLFKKIPINFQNNTTDYFLLIEKKELIPGINILTLINEQNKPVSERMVFNDAKNPLRFLDIASITKVNDSSIIKLHSSNKSLKNLSVSILPEKTESYTFNDNISTALLLKPYLKGSIENSNYYFKDSNKKTFANLDLLLLTQGWSKFNWTGIFSQTPKAIYSFESGFQIKGTLNNTEYNKKNKLVLMSNENNIILNTPLDQKNSFIFSNLYLKDSSNINLSIQSSKNKFKKPYIYYTLTPRYQVDSIDTSKLIFNNKSNYTPSVKNIESSVFDGLNQIEEVEIISKSKKKFKNNPVGLNGLKVKKIKLSEELNQSGLVKNIIRNYGFKVEVVQTIEGDILKIETRRVMAWYNEVVNFSPLIKIDDVVIPSRDFLFRLNDLRIEDLEEMFISNDGSMYGSDGFAGIINIYTKTDFKRNFKADGKFHKSTIDFGFTDQKEYYSPLYKTKYSQSFKAYGVINWVPNIIQKLNGELYFKIPNYTYGNVNLYIEGMADDGSLYSKTERIKLN